MNFQQAIDLLTTNFPDALWDTLQTMEELENALHETINENADQDTTDFCMSVFANLN